MHKTDISVFITSFNQRNFLVEAIESVHAQTLRPFEIIIVKESMKDTGLTIADALKNEYDKMESLIGTHTLMGKANNI
jgi:glycosyltransferase involved in cell wall biosynthesis